MSFRNRRSPHPCSLSRRSNKHDGTKGSISKSTMVTPQSPTPMFNGLDDDLYNDAKYAHEINDKMRVPKRIKATGEFSDEDLLLSNQNGMINSWNYHDKIDMNVPDRIVVLGHNQHLETRSAPREILLENSILPKNPSMGFMRVQTPPRVITLENHHFPSASEESTPLKPNGNFYGNDLDGDVDEDDDEQRATQYVRSNGNIRMGFHNGNDANSVESDSQVSF
ncbi:hypothetical protein ACLKA6_006581 [Drosophila palustris]